MDSSAENASSSDNVVVKKTNPVKLVLLGESAVGKSSVVYQFVNREFIDNREPTIGAGFMTQKCVLNDRTVKFEIWDTAGQERFHSLAPMYYRNAHAAIVAYDITKASTLDQAKSWVKELQRQANGDIVIALVGNKLDLIQDENENPSDEYEREVSKEDAQAYADEHGLLFFETSAKTAVNVDAVFFLIAQKIPLDNLYTSNNRNLAGGKNDQLKGSFFDQSFSDENSGSCAC